LVAAGIAVVILGAVSAVSTEVGITYDTISTKLDSAVQ
jgi:Flp pilus assembly pilin Flp